MDFYFGSDYDMTLDGGDIAFTDSDNEVEQRLLSRLQFIKGEWFLDVTAGLPYPQIIFEAGTSLDDIYALLSQKIKDTDGVETLDNLNITVNADERNITVEFSINNGSIAQSVVIP
jgi:hypothetical protein